MNSFFCYKHYLELERENTEQKDGMLKAHLILQTERKGPRKSCDLPRVAEQGGGRAESSIQVTCQLVLVRHSHKDTREHFVFSQLHTYCKRY